MNGILPLWKPSGMTSHDCVMRIRRIFNTKKVGHTGTLDPEVEGVLPICIGHATKIVSYLTETNKTYVAEVMLGKATDTEDSYGKMIEESRVTKFPSENEIDNVLQLFKGRIRQVPPMYSAVKVKGKKLYEYARENETVERPSREVIIHDLKRLSSPEQERNVFQIEIVCSKGTYIRTLCVDVGKKLGYPAHMSGLIRMESASFTKENTVTFNDLEEAAKLDQQNQLLMPVMKGLDHLDILYVDPETKRKVLHGQKMDKPIEVLHTDPFVVMCDDKLLAIYQTHPDKPEQIKPVRVFNG
ncbi:tRNA pseudouridine55 synthase [Virgibacillus natechei]|uniref:tRNA pseudouridine synthase B n=1 Tax=Virgibacillus natechei TaxID=1216297 RepID=A0ABS4IBL8_9BACI|nr:tRNA pseudouridine(55) synthase TruB [Virgibacillus natechei]MBP1968060.1 tRNA pseudouridine55 synthase [Virgibacillus natechei]UZD14659.1 tRNA pseudouridine(55) synthase TruB [Virgibacillus natechei]